MKMKMKTKCGHMRIVVDLDFFDGDEFIRAVKRVVEEVVQQGSSSQSPVVIRCGIGWPGRAPLTEKDWQKRFDMVEKILRSKESLGITLEQACAREGIPYSTFRYWRGKMKTDKLSKRGGF